MSKKCPRCQYVANDTDNFCAHCGTSFQPKSGFLFSHSGIILMIFLLGPFAIPFVLTSTVIGKLSKWLYSVFLAIYIIALVYYCYKMYLILAETLPSLLNVNI